MGKIQSKKQYKDIVRQESLYYKNGYNSLKEYLYLRIKKEIDTFYIWSYMKSLRKAEYYKNVRSFPFLINTMCYLFAERKKNRLGAKLGFSISDDVLGWGSILYHPNVVINPKSKLGNGILLHGNNCIGNKGNGFVEAPVLGDDIELGFGASVIGGVTLANNIKVGANAVVISSFKEEGITIAGIPAKKIS